MSNSIRNAGRNFVSPYAETARRKRDRAVNRALRNAQFMGLDSFEDENLMELETSARFTNVAFSSED